MKILRRFYMEIGPEKMLDCYGWDAPPDRLCPGESMLALDILKAQPMKAEQAGTVPVSYYFQHDDEGGWATLLRDPREPAIQELAIGVFPKYQGRGFRKLLLRRASDWAFEHNGAETVSVFINAGNMEQIEKYEDDERRGGPFKKSGLIWFPEPEAGARFTRVKPGMDGSNEDLAVNEKDSYREVGMDHPELLDVPPLLAPPSSTMEWTRDIGDPYVSVWIDGKILHIRRKSS